MRSFSFVPLLLLLTLHQALAFCPSVFHVRATVPHQQALHQDYIALCPGQRNLLQSRAGKGDSPGNDGENEFKEALIDAELDAQAEEWIAGDEKRAAWWAKMKTAKDAAKKSQANRLLGVESSINRLRLQLRSLEELTGLELNGEDGGFTSLGLALIAATYIVPIWIAVALSSFLVAAVQQSLG
ncbi:unnamed protein product [Phaeothamnion confervicola]